MAQSRKQKDVASTGAKRASKQPRSSSEPRASSAPLATAVQIRASDGAGAPRPLVVGISGATGAILGVRLLEVLRSSAIETHLVLSQWGARTLLHETQYTVEQVQRLATRSYSPHDQGAAISSGSFLTRVMVVCPCSARNLAAIEHGQC